MQVLSYIDSCDNAARNTQAPQSNLKLCYLQDMKHIASRLIKKKGKPFYTPYLNKN